MKEDKIKEIVFLQKILKEKKEFQMKTKIQKESLLEKLKNEYNCCDIQQAKDLLKIKQQEFDKINIEEKMNEFKREFNL